MELVNITKVKNVDEADFMSNGCGKSLAARSTSASCRTLTSKRRWSGATEKEFGFSALLILTGHFRCGRLVLGQGAKILSGSTQGIYPRHHGS